MRTKSINFLATPPLRVPFGTTSNLVPSRLRVLRVYRLEAFTKTLSLP